MRKSTLIILLAAATFCALSISWLWALDPLFRLFDLNTPAETEADYVRYIWHFRLLQPEWVSNPPTYLKWAKAESITRLVIVSLCWLGSITLVVRRYLRRRGTPPNNSPHATAAAPDS